MTIVLISGTLILLKEKVVDVESLITGDCCAQREVPKHKTKVRM